MKSHLKLSIKILLRNLSLLKKEHAIENNYDYKDDDYNYGDADTGIDTGVDTDVDNESNQELLKKSDIKNQEDIKNDKTLKLLLLTL